MASSAGSAADHPLAYLVGRTVPGGEYAIAPYESWLAHDAVYSEPGALPHPVMAFVAAQRGMGCTVTELFALLESDIADGPLLASTSIDIRRDLRTDERYRVEGQVLGLTRKSGAVLGTFDLVTCEFHLWADDGAPVATVRNVYAIGRR